MIPPFDILSVPIFIGEMCVNVVDCGFDDAHGFIEFFGIQGPPYFVKFYKASFGPDIQIFLVPV